MGGGGVVRVLSRSGVVGHGFRWGMVPAVRARGVSGTTRTTTTEEGPGVRSSDPSARIDDPKGKVEEAAVENTNADENERPRTAVGGFVRGLFGGSSVAAEDDYIARAKEAGIEVPVSARSEVVHVRRRPRPSEDTTDDDSIRGRIFSRFKESQFMKGAFEAQERIKERIDESENPVIRFLRGMYDRVFAENEHAQVIRAVRETDPTFQISKFLSEMEGGRIETVLKAYLEGDEDRLRETCLEPAYDVFLASIKEREATGYQLDTNILSIDDVQFSGGTFLDDNPVLLLQFSAQQINCVRDRLGKIVEGKEDDIQAVYYYWALCREFNNEDEDVDENDESQARKGNKNNGTHPWKVLEIVIRGRHSTI
mmetsp:Transcript_11157/g.22215  ORF Transcript_11157/g.22215 Transcript_11157/m.22215 type:complete len:368 (-) Transcript_11157:112-1215(-)